MREILTLHLGQTGIALGSTCWEVLQLESLQNHDANAKGDMWTTHSDHRLTPKALFVDSEPANIDYLQRSSLGEKLQPHQMVSGDGDMGGVYQRFNGAQLAERTLEGVRVLAEDSSSLQGFIVFHSLAGGTGTALSELLLPRLKELFPHSVTHTVNVLPSGAQEKAVAPYNACLSAHHLLDQCDISFLFDNQALANIAHSALGIECPTYSSLNQIVAQAYSALTSSLRFDGCLNVDLAEFMTNLVPYPRIHNCMLSYSPYYSTLKPYYPTTSTYEVSRLLFTPISNLITCDTFSGQFLSCALCYRGHVTPKDICPVLCSLKTDRKVKFVDWSPAGFKSGIECHTPAVIPTGDLEVTPRSILAISNNTAVKTAYQRIVTDVRKLLGQKSFLHWYLREGIEEMDFNEALEDIQALLLDYEEVETPVSEDS